MGKPHEFAIYAGDDFVASGTAKELAKKFGFKPEHVRYLSTPAHQRKLAKSKKPTGRAKYAIKLGPQEAL
ncbi:MAG TPA: hypothetical protein VFT87_01115 [Candidatus Saccharimonadales bacterium]|nr:hypothetical protein [Candidatus Saccharimonadales bacterium]